MNETTGPQGADEVELWCAKVLDPEQIRRWRRDEKISEILGHIIKIAWWGTLFAAAYVIFNCVRQVVD